MFDEKPKMVEDPAKMGKKVANYWDAAKRLLADPTRFLDSLITFDKDNIKDAIIQRIQPYIDMEEFTPEAVARVSCQEASPRGDYLVTLVWSHPEQ